MRDVITLREVQSVTWYDVHWCLHHLSGGPGSEDLTAVVSCVHVHVQVMECDVSSICEIKLDFRPLLGDVSSPWLQNNTFPFISQGDGVFSCFSTKNRTVNNSVLSSININMFCKRNEVIYFMWRLCECEVRASVCDVHLVSGERCNAGCCPRSWWSRCKQSAVFCRYFCCFVYLFYKRTCCSERTGPVHPLSQSHWNL